VGLILGWLLVGLLTVIVLVFIVRCCCGYIRSQRNIPKPSEHEELGLCDHDHREEISMRQPVEGNDVPDRGKNEGKSLAVLSEYEVLSKYVN
jgi:hypothetical protein